MVNSLNYIWDDERSRRTGEALEKFDLDRKEIFKEWLRSLQSMPNSFCYSVLMD
jgi:hypothetical protein